MRWLLLACGPMNLGFAAVFAPPMTTVRRAVGFFEPPQICLWALTAWILAFGAAYFGMGWTARVIRPILAVGAFGKASFGVIVLWLLASGEITGRTALIGLPDLILAGLFATWLFTPRRRKH